MKSLITILITGLLGSTLLSGCGEIGESIGKPPNLRLDRIGDYDAATAVFGLVRLEWDEATDAASYQLQRAAPDEGRDFEFIQWAYARNSEDGGYLLNGPFLPGHTYVYRVRGFNRVGGPWSDELNVTIPRFVPPENLTATYDEQNNMVVLEWDAGDNLEQVWSVLRVSSSGQLEGHQEETYEPRFEDRHVAPGCEYEYEVAAIHRMYGPTDVSTVTIETPEASPPVMREATEGDPVAITVSWDQPGDHGIVSQSYRLYRATADPESPGSYEPIQEGTFTLNNGRVEYVDEHVAYGMWHYYRVRSLFGGFQAGCASQSEMSESYVAGWAGPISPNDPPPEPTGFSATGQSWDQSIRLEWDAVSTADSYRVYRVEFDEHTDPNLIINYTAGFTRMADVPRDGEVLRYDDHDTVNGRAYYYYVRAENANGAGPPTEVVQGHWGNATVPGKPVVSATQWEYSDAIVATWPETANAKWYRVYSVNTSHGEIEIVEALSGWITDTRYIHFTDSRTWFVVRALSESGIVGPQSEITEGIVDPGMPPYSD